MSFLQNLFSNGLSSAVDSVGNALDNLITSKEEKLQIELEEKKAEQQYNIEMKKLDVDETKAFLQDTASARDMNSRVQESDKASWLSKNIPYIFDCFILLIWGFMTVYIVLRWLGFLEATKTNIDMTGVLGIYSGVTALATMVIQFHRGSSKGSQEKTTAINDLMRR